MFISARWVGILLFLLFITLGACSTQHTASEQPVTHTSSDVSNQSATKPESVMSSPVKSSAAGSMTADKQIISLTDALESEAEFKAARQFDRDDVISQPVLKLVVPIKSSEKNRQQPLLAAPPLEKARLVSESERLVAKKSIPLSAPSPAGLMLQDQRYIRAPSEPLDRENYQHFADNPVKRVAEAPVSTFSIDVDTGSYTNVRRLLNEGRLPHHDAVRAEEFINYFDYQYPLPEKNGQPFSVTTEIAPTPWNKDTLLLHVGLKGYQEQRQNLPPANLVFLIDVSGSMHAPAKLDLLKLSLKLLVNQLRSQDRISLVVYAGASGVVLNPTPGDQKATILNALDSLEAGGSTNGAAGIRLAYRTAEQAFIKDGINRILLCTDGDFNVGTVNFEQLINLVEEKRQTGIAISTFGFGRGNLNDKLAEQIADHGNGQYAYIDNLIEAQKVLVDEMSATLLTIAKDVKIQMEFNPAVVAEYRLIGYVNRKLAREDFNNDAVDAGEIGAGHTVTALYEIALVNGQGQRIDPLRYGKNKSLDQTLDQSTQELAFLKLRYKLPNADQSTLVTTPIFTEQQVGELAQASPRFKFSASVAAFAQKLRGGKYLNHYSYSEMIKLARQALHQDTSSHRANFVNLVSLAQSLSGEVASVQ